MKFENSNYSLLLPHELQMLNTELTAATHSLGVTADAVGEAMEQSSETWHDNAPADAALEELAKARGKVAMLAHIKENHQLVDYPSPDEPRIHIGSAATIHIPDWSETFSLLVTGAVRNLYPVDSYRDIVDEVMSYVSPMAAALLNLKSGERGLATINDGSVGVEVVSVSQGEISEVARRAV